MFRQNGAGRSLWRAAPAVQPSCRFRTALKPRTRINDQDLNRLLSFLHSSTDHVNSPVQPDPSDSCKVFTSNSNDGPIAIHFSFQRCILKGQLRIMADGNPGGFNQDPSKDLVPPMVKPRRNGLLAAAATARYQTDIAAELIQ